MSYIEPLRDLNDLSPKYCPGFNKKWPLKTPTDYELLHDYLQKVNYSIQDFNATIENGFTQNRKDIIFLVALTDWIIEATEKIPECYRDEIVSAFAYSREFELARIRACGLQGILQGRTFFCSCSSTRNG